MAEHTATEAAVPAPEEPVVAAPAAAGLGPVPATTAAAIQGLQAGTGMAAQLARAAVTGMGNQAVGRVLARSPLSDELKDVNDTQCEAAVIARLRTLTVSDPDVEAMIAAELGGDALTLAKLLVHYGDESMWPAPVEEYQTPFDNAPQSTSGERIIMNGEYLIVPDAIAHFHELKYTAVNGTFDTQGGPASKTFTTGHDVNRIDTGNVSFFLPDPFKDTDTATVTAEIRIRSTGRVVHTRTWNYTPRGDAPTEVTQVEPGTERAIGSSFTYDVGPPRIPLAAPWYEHQTVLEEFSSRTSNLDVGDMDPAWLTANGITDKAGIDRALFSAGSNNGTFVVDHDDRFYDQHGGGQDTLDEAASHLATPKDVHVDLPQVYTAGPGNVLGNFIVRRIRHVDGSYGLRKWKV
jgi:hypothetical protein